MNLDSIAQELDRLYEFEISRYIERCDELKKSGFKVYRNSSGQHKVAYGGQGGQGSQSAGRSRRQPERYEAVNDKKDNIFIRAKKRVKRSIEIIRSVIGFIKYLRNSQK